MSISTKPLEQITRADLEALCAEKNDWARERRTIDYKERLPGQAPDDPAKFADDVASFANASGGDLIFGIREDNGLPVELVGCEGAGDDQQNRLKQIASARIEPNVPHLEMHSVTIDEKRSCLIVRVGGS